MSKRVSVVSASLFLALLVAMPAAAESDSAGWLKRMGRAVEQLNYRGTLVHTYLGEADVTHIVHRVADNKTWERITSMGDGGREILRRDDVVICIFPDQKLIMVDHQKAGDIQAAPGTGKLPTFMVVDASTYEIVMHGKGRVSGRQAEVLSVRPKDDLRYGYRLWVDRSNAMLLQSQLVDDQGRVVEQFMFTEISFPESIPAAELEPSIYVESFDWERRKPAVHIPEELNAAGWRATELPNGFVLAAVRSMQAESGRREQLVYSDGIASVSVFVEIEEAGAEPSQGWSQIGASNAYTITLQGHMITAVGDVPERTAKMIAMSVQPGDGPRASQ